MRSNFTRYVEPYLAGVSGIIVQKFVGGASYHNDYSMGLIC